MASWGISTSGKMVFLGFEKDTPKNGPQPGDIVVRRDGRYRILSDGSEYHEGDVCMKIAEDVGTFRINGNLRPRAIRTRSTIFK